MDPAFFSPNRPNGLERVSHICLIAPQSLFVRPSDSQHSQRFQPVTLDTSVLVVADVSFLLQAWI